MFSQGHVLLPDSNLVELHEGARLDQERELHTQAATQLEVRSLVQDRHTPSIPDPHSSHH